VNQDFKDLLRVFKKEKVRYLIVGGYAVIKHAEPRYTKDLDVWVAADRENAERVYRALTEFGAPIADMKPEDFEHEGYFFTMGIAPSRIDIFLGLEQLDFEESWEKRVVATLDNTEIYFIAKDDLIKNKEAIGRLQDLADVEKLKLEK